MPDDYYIGFKKERWVDGNYITWTNFAEIPFTGTLGVLRISEMFKWYLTDGHGDLSFVCQRISPPLISMKQTKMS